MAGALASPTCLGQSVGDEDKGLVGVALPNEASRRRGDRYRAFDRRGRRLGNIGRNGLGDGFVDGRDRDRRGHALRRGSARFLRADNQQKDPLVANRNPGDAGGTLPTVHGKRRPHHRPVAVARLLDQAIDGAGGRGQHIETAGGAKHPGAAIENGDEAIVGGDGVRQPFGAGRKGFAVRIDRADGENAASARAEIEPAACRRQSDLADAEVETENLKPRLVDGKRLGEAGEAARRGARWRKTAIEQRAHARLAEEGNAGGIRP